MNELVDQHAMAVAPASIKDLEQAARYIVDSKLFGIKEVPQAVSLMLIAQAEGLHYATACQDYDIVAGRAARKTHSVLARFQSAGGTIRWLELSNMVAKAEFTHPKGGSVTIEWTMDMASKIMMESWDNRPGAEKGAKIKTPLTDKENWKNYPRAMLRARCIAEGVRTVFPAAIGGHLVAEEAVDLPEEVDIAVHVEQPKARSEQTAAGSPAASAKEEKGGTTIDGSATRVDDAGGPTLAECKAMLDKGDVAGATDLARGLSEADRKSFDDARLATVASNAGNGTEKPLAPGQQRILKARCNTAGVTITELEQKIGKSFDAFTFGDFEPAQRWLLEKGETK